MRKVIYISGTRAEFGLMRTTLGLINASPFLDLSVCLTGMHLLPKYGYTAKEVESSGIRICGKIEVAAAGESSGQGASIDCGMELIGFAKVFAKESPDCIIVLGDRGEMLAAAIAAIHMNIAIIHIHGGERTGTIDESIRHAISKLAHYHFVATQESKERLIKMGEKPSCIFRVGAPGLDCLLELARHDKNKLLIDQGFNSDEPIGIVLFHPVVQENEFATQQIAIVVEAVIKSGIQAMFFMPNSDPGGDQIYKFLQQCAKDSKIKVVTHLERTEYVSWLKAANVIIGNSSSGIIEAETLKIPTVNVGSRQANREQNKHTINTAVDITSIQDGISKALVLKSNVCDADWQNIYGDGNAGERMAKLLIELPLSKEVLCKMNTF